MNCFDAEQLFDAYLDHELAGSLRLEFDAHRLRCTLCQQKLAMMEACESTLRGDSDVPTLAPDFTDRLMASIEQRPMKLHAARRRRVAIAAIGLQAAAVVAFAFVWNWMGRSTPAPESDVVVMDEATFDERLTRAMEERDKTELVELMFQRRDYLDYVRSFSEDVGNDVAGLMRFADNSVVRLGQTGSFDQLNLFTALENLLPGGHAAEADTQPTNPPAQPAGPEEYRL